MLQGGLVSCLSLVSYIQEEAQEEAEIEYWEGTWTKERFKAIGTSDTSKVLSIF